MSLVHGKRIGEIQLRDFKALFDRPGFFRYHFKAVDQEFGMVKEEVKTFKRLIVFVQMLMEMYFQITSDDAILPGSDGKIVAWVDED